MAFPLLGLYFSLSGQITSPGAWDKQIMNTGYPFFIHSCLADMQVE